MAAPAKVRETEMQRPRGIALDSPCSDWPFQHNEREEVKKGLGQLCFVEDRFRERSNKKFSFYLMDSILQMK